MTSLTPENLNNSFSRRFGKTPTVLARAPGRIEFIGNHTDYNGGMVLGAAIDRYVAIAAAPTSDTRIRLVSGDDGEAVLIDATELQPLKGRDAWTNYVLGVLVELRKRGYPWDRGFDAMVFSDLPAGAGLSSSAALELASVGILQGLAHWELPLIEQVRAARAAENHFVGMPCGILDQGVSGFGAVDHLVQIDCATETFNRLPLPKGVHFWVINTNEKHSLIDSFYARRVEECVAAKEALETFFGAPLEGPLATVTPEKFEEAADSLPEVLAKRARHIIEEHARVKEVAALLKADGDLRSVGALLFASHESSRTLYENSTTALDTLVDLAREQVGVYGARLTGGGFGGAVMLMTDASFDQSQADAIVSAYTAKRPDASIPSVFHVRTGAGAGPLV